MVSLIKPISLGLIVLLLSPLLSGCQLSYIIHAGQGHIDLWWNRELIEDVIQDPQTPPKTRAELEKIEEIKVFVTKNLHLKVTDNYRHYVQLDRPYVSWLLTAAPRDELKAYKWSFPLIGSFPYLGFYKKELAEEEELKMRERGFDTYVRGVTAYSTLGWFSDPVLSSMLDHSEESLVNTVIHECVHANIWISNSVEFNEQLAVYIAEKGTAYYYEQKGQLDTVEALEKKERDLKRFSQFLGLKIKELKEGYEQKLISENDRELYFSKIQQDYQINVLPEMETRSFDWFGKIKLNNARIVALEVYLKDYSIFDKAFQKSQAATLADFTNQLQFLQKSADPKADLEKWITER